MSIVRGMSIYQYKELMKERTKERINVVVKWTLCILVAILIIDNAIQRSKIIQLEEKQQVLIDATIRMNELSITGATERMNMWGAINRIQRGDE